jgi:hypothetical protein
MPCAKPTLGAAPVSDSNSSTHRFAGTKCTTMRTQRKPAGSGPYPTIPGRGALRAGRGVEPAAATTHLMLVVLRDTHADLRDLMLLIAIHDPQIPRPGQIMAACAPPLRKPVYLAIRSLHPGKVRTRRVGLLAPPAVRATASTWFRLPRQRLVGLQQIRDLHG